jgi:membrane protease YdiL (CAAX protease family)
MKKIALALVALLFLAGVAEVIVLRRMALDPVKLGAVLLSLSLLLGAFVGLTDSGLVRELRHAATRSIAVAGVIPLALMAPYLIYALGTRTFSSHALLKLAAYLLAPVALLLPDRMHRAEQSRAAGWRDFAALLALGFPISAHWLAGIWTWPFELYFFQPLTAVCVGSYSFMVVRNLDDVGYKLTLRKADWTDGLANFVAFSLLAAPLGYALHFIHFRPQSVTLTGFAGRLLGIYLTIAIPEELLFRGILQNLLVRSIRHGPKGLPGLLIASLVFGASHLHHAPVPNWRYGIMASMAGIFYGNAYRTRHRLSAPALTHALVDTAWHFWF